MDLSKYMQGRVSVLGWSLEINDDVGRYEAGVPTSAKWS